MDSTSYLAIDEIGRQIGSLSEVDDENCTLNEVNEDFTAEA